MKKIILTLLCGSLLLAEAPQWFGASQTGEPSYMIVGYGEADNIERAKTLAKDDISKSIRTTVKSSVSSSQKRQGDNFDSSFALSIEAKNSMTLTNVEPLRQEEVDGIWYVALKYDNRPIEEKISDKFTKNFCVQKSATHPFVQASPLYKKIKKSLGCDIDMTVVRHNQMWNVKALDGELFPMAPLDFEKLFFNKSNEHLTFQSNKRVLKDGDEFVFSAKSDKVGYITLLTMYEDGIVTVLEPSKTISKNKMSELPSPERELVLEAATLENGSATFDLYILLYSKQALDTSRFEYATEALASSENAYKFEELLDLMRDNSYATIRLTTNPR